jgi:hypothetical protein
VQIWKICVAGVERGDGGGGGGGGRGDNWPLILNVLIFLARSFEPHTDRIRNGVEKWDSRDGDEVRTGL